MNDKIHNFDVEDAMKYGVNRAIVLYTIRNWIDYKARNKKGLHKAEDGNSYYFAYASASALSEKIPYLSKSAINDALNYFIENKVLIKGKFNKMKWDKTLWYADASQPFHPIDTHDQNPAIDVASPVIGKAKVDDVTIPSDIPSDTSTDVKDLKSETSDVQGINAILGAFKKKINPVINFGNKTQRKAAQELIDEFGLEQVLFYIDYLVTVSGNRYAPTITNPLQLKEKYAALIIFAQREENNTKKTALTVI